MRYVSEILWVNYIKAQRLKWFAHVKREDNEELIKKIKDWRPAEDRPRARPRKRWEEQDMENIRKLKIVNIKRIIKNRKERFKIIDVAKTSL